MTVQELIYQLTGCSPRAHIVVPCQGCGEEAAEPALVIHDDCVVVMCKACCGSSQRSTGDMDEFVRAAQAMLDARADHMLTRLEWEALERAVASVTSRPMPAPESADDESPA